MDVMKLNKHVDHDMWFHTIYSLDCIGDHEWAKVSDCVVFDNRFDHCDIDLPDALWCAAGDCCFMISLLLRGVLLVSMC